jgi:cell division septation protein DedD
MTANDRRCETTVFDGQRLTLKSDDVPQAAPAPAKPTSSRRHGASKRQAAVVEEPAKKPETTSSISSSISSMFGRKSSQ